MLVTHPALALLNVNIYATLLCYDTSSPSWRWCNRCSRNSPVSSTEHFTAGDSDPQPLFQRFLVRGFAGFDPFPVLPLALAVVALPEPEVVTVFFPRSITKLSSTLPLGVTPVT